MSEIEERSAVQVIEREREVQVRTATRLGKRIQ
jgi:hypothetical protein